jgi:hypothetical protein
MDKIVVDLDTDQRECIACGFSEARPGVPAAKQPAASADAVAELPTRVSRAAARRVETRAEPVRLLDPRNKDKE